MSPHRDTLNRVKPLQDLSSYKRTCPQTKWPIGRVCNLHVFYITTIQETICSLFYLKSCRNIWIVYNLETLSCKFARFYNSHVKIVTIKRHFRSYRTEIKINILLQEQCWLGGNMNSLKTKKINCQIYQLRDLFLHCMN